MFATRTAAQSTSRVLRVTRPLKFRNARFQSTLPSGSSSGSSPALVGGLAGGTVALVGCYAWYHFSGAKTLVNAAHETKSYMQSARNRLVEKTPEPNEALKWLRQASTYYAGFIPGASGYVETTFDDLDKIHDKHRDEVDQIVKDAYNELKELSGKDMNLATAQQAFEVLQKHGKRIGELAGDAAQDVLDNHPQLKKQVGGNLDQLKNMGEQYGPEAKKQVDETWNQIKDITKNGINSDTADKIRKLVQEKVEQLKKLGDETWKKGLETAKPYFDKNPKIKELVEENTDALKQGNFEQLYDMVKSAAESGDTSDLEKYVKDTANKAKESGVGGFDQILKTIPGGDQVLPQLQSLQQIAEKHGEEAKKLFEETIQEVTQVLNKKADQAKDLAKNAEQTAK
jgi:arsenate reductase-like glutaredoxin family protein